MQNDRLEETVASRTSELAAAHANLKMLDCAKDDFLKVISHELRTPLNGLFGVSEIFFEEPSLLVESDELRKMFDQSRRRIICLLDDALLLTQIDVDGKHFKSTPVSLGAALGRAVELTSAFAECRKIRLDLPSVDHEVVRGNEDLLVRALHALLESAMRFSSAAGTVRVVCENLPDSLRVTIATEGRTISNAAAMKFFDVFSLSEPLAPGEDFGLGPPLAFRILALSGATVTIANRDEAGIRIVLAFRR